MVMTNQVDFLDLIFGDKPGTVSDAGELNFYVPTQRQLDQQLDMEDLFDNSDLSFAPSFMEDAFLADDTCVPSEEIVMGVIEAPQETPQEAPQENPQETPQENPQETPSTSGSEQQQQLIFQFPPILENSSFQELLVSDDMILEPLDPPETPSTPFSPSSSYSESLPPPTPDTASSMDSVSSHIPTFLKQGLKSSILEKRRKQGKGEIKVEFTPPAPEQLTPEEEAKRVEKRARNKLAAQKCREKKRERGDILEAETKKLEKEQTKYKTEIEKLIEERDHLMDILKIHGAVCPKLRAILRVS